MPTISEAAKMLGVGRVTLEKWMKRLEITPTRHPQDWRFWCLTDEQVQQIANERAKMPGHINKHLYVALRAESDGLGYDDASPIVTSAPRQRPLRTEASSPLPDGMMSRTDAADSHGVPRSTFRRWCDDGRVETAHETYGGERGQFAIAQPVTRSGLAQLYALAHRRSDFQACQDCPHASAAIVAAETSADGGGDEG